MHSKTHKIGFGQEDLTIEYMEQLGRSEVYRLLCKSAAAHHEYVINQIDSNERVREYPSTADPHYETAAVVARNSEGRIVGAVNFSEKPSWAGFGYINFAWVVTDYRRNGLHRYLVDAAINEMLCRNIRTIIRTSALANQYMMERIEKDIRFAPITIDYMYQATASEIENAKKVANQFDPETKMTSLNIDPANITAKEREAMELLQARAMPRSSRAAATETILDVGATTTTDMDVINSAIEDPGDTDWTKSRTSHEHG